MINKVNLFNAFAAKAEQKCCKPQCPNFRGNPVKTDVFVVSTGGSEITNYPGPAKFFITTNSIECLEKLPQDKVLVHTMVNNSDGKEVEFTLSNTNPEKVMDKMGLEPTSQFSNLTFVNNSFSHIVEDPYNSGIVTKSGRTVKTLSSYVEEGGCTYKDEINDAERRTFVSSLNGFTIKEIN